MKDQGKKFILGLTLLPIGVLSHGYVLMKLWEMFISTTFKLPEISLIQAAGLTFVVDFILLKIDMTPYADEIDFASYSSKYIAHMIVTPFVCLGIGYILNLFM